MADFPRAAGFDSSLALLAEGYLFIGNCCRRLQSDVFETRLLLKRAICMQGEEAAKVFFFPGRFTRVGATPAPVLMSLQDAGSVQTLDGEAHRWRKEMFMSLMTPTSLQRMCSEFEAAWRASLPRWQLAREMKLFPEVSEVLLRAVCAWAGVPLSEPDAKERVREFRAMIDGAGSPGPRNWRGLLLRSRTERWARNLVWLVRAGRLPGAVNRPLGIVALHRDPDGKLLDLRTAAVELLNLLRPAVAIDRYIVFTALALHEHPRWRKHLQSGDDQDLRSFVQEVRRLGPFFPAIAGRVREEFEWRGHHFSRGRWFILDIYGTNRDPRIWQDPEEFRPERFQTGSVATPFNFIPQGGGGYLDGHRCAGEWLTVEIMMTALRLLTGSMTYRVPPQDLSMSLSRIPAIPRSGFIITDVRSAA